MIFNDFPGFDLEMTLTSTLQMSLLYIILKNILNVVKNMGKLIPNYQIKIKIFKYVVFTCVAILDAKSEKVET